MRVEEAAVSFANCHKGRTRSCREPKTPWSHQEISRGPSETPLVESLQILYEMILRLADSRARHKGELHREKLAQEKRIVGTERAHARALTEAMEKARSDSDRDRKTLQSILKEEKAQRTILVPDIGDPLDRLCKTVRSGGDVQAPDTRGGIYQCS